MIRMTIIGILAAVLLFVGNKKDASTYSFTDHEETIEHISNLSETVDHYENIIQMLLPGYEQAQPFFSTQVTVTSYNPVEAQCDDTPLINSANQLVAPGQVAISQGFRKRIGLEFGDFIILENFGLFVVTDHMNKRYDGENRIDIISFIPEWSKKFGVKQLKMFWW